MRDNFKKVIAIVLLLIFLIAGGLVFFQQRQAGNIQQAVAETRRLLRTQGFKTDLADFNLKTDAPLRARETALTFFNSYGYAQPRSAVDAVDLLPAVADGSAVVVWKQDQLMAQGGTITWSALRDALDENRLELDSACEAALSGPIQYELDAGAGRAMLLRHLAPLRRLGLTLGSRTVMELHDAHSNTGGDNLFTLTPHVAAWKMAPAEVLHSDAAWTNLLALTRLVTAWNVEPAEVSHLVRFGLVNFAFDATWQALQDNRWADERLASLQREWEALDVWTNLPETVAFQRASDTDLCRQERQQPIGSVVPLGEILKESFQAPGTAFTALKRSWSATRYRSYGTYADEKSMLLFYQQREVDVRHAIASPTWEQMRVLPRVTNPPSFMSPYGSTVMDGIHFLHITSISMVNPNSSLLSRAAIAEAHRRVMIAAIALERFRLEHGTYPKAITELVPEFLKTAPVDFMDGQPLRYRISEDGHFVLYSVGLDCVDNGGKLSVPATRPGRRTGLGVGPAPDTDIVWPLPATPDAVTAQNEEDLDDVRTKADEIEDLQAHAQWEHTARHQAELEALLAAAPVTNVPDTQFRGSPLSGVLRNPQTAGTNHLSLVEMLTLKQITTGREPETVTFELPIAYDVMTNLGELHLFIDPTNNDDSDLGCNVMDLDCSRASNGNCLLAWGTIYESPDRHALQAGLLLNDLSPEEQNFDGPLLPFTVTNLCQFSLTSQHFEPGIGASFHAKLPETNASYVIELNTTTGDRLKTISGSTSNGELKVFWNLMDDHGQRFTGDEFNSVFHLTFPDSGQTQTLRGP